MTIFFLNHVLCCCFKEHFLAFFWITRKLFTPHPSSFAPEGNGIGTEHWANYLPPPPLYMAAPDPPSPPTGNLEGGGHIRGGGGVRVEFACSR